MIINFSSKFQIPNYTILFSSESFDNLNSSRKIFSMNQVHSNKISLLDKFNQNDKLDGLLAINSSSILSVKTADCLPIFIYHNSRNIFGILHAGWRGLSNGIINNLVQLLLDQNLNPSDFSAFIGPSICQKNYEVTKEMQNYFPGKFFKTIDKKLFLSLQDFTIENFSNFGINTLFCNECTYENKNYHSYRKSKTSQRITGIIYRNE